MDPNYITPFIASVQNVFSTMLNLTVDVGEPHVKVEPTPSFDVSGIIGMSGDVAGSVVLSFPMETAARIVSIFAGQPLTAKDADFPDAVGELVNMISGGAKASFQGKKASISCPNVVIGAGHTVARLKDVPCIVIPCSTDCGQMVIEISVQERASASAGASPAAATAGVRG